MTLEFARIRFVRIQTDELETFSGLICRVAQELENRGQKLWDQKWLQPQALLEAYGLESMYLGRINGEVVAGFVLIESDPTFWPNVTMGESIFIHKIAVARAFKGQHLSSQILDFAVRQTLERDKKFLRLDTDITRPALCNLYERYGFVRVGQRMIGTFECALYELEVGA